MFGVPSLEAFFTHNMNANMFLWLLRAHILSQAQVFHENEWWIVMDNDPKHTSKRIQIFSIENVQNKLPCWPSQSLDLTPIENLFAWMKSELLKIGPKTIFEYKESLEEIWENIQPEFLRPFCDSMTHRCKLFQHSKGHPIKY